MDTKALRQKILDLAIRGKLVPQDANDEPASVLLERIRAEKQQMVKDGKLKAKDIKNDTVIFKGDDNLHYEQFADGTVKCIEDEIPFELPDGWAWTRLGVICPYGENKAVSADLIDETSWILDLEDIEKETGVIKKYATKSERNSVSNKYSFYKGQLLYSKLRPYLNKVVIAPKDGYCTTEILPLTFYGNIYSPYMQLFIMSPTFLIYVNMISYGVKMPRLGTNDGKNAIIAIPPIKEQKRIRDKFDIITPLFDIIQKNINNLNNEVTAIKSKILDLAIRGKLVPQNPNDEPASVLLERIRAEKEELIKQGKIKRDKKESVIFKGDDNSYYEKIGDEITCIDDELPFEIPDSWCWARLSSFTKVIMGSSPRSQDICRDSNYTEFHQGKIYFSDCLLKESNQYTKNISKIAPKNSVLLCVRAPVGEVNITDREICIGRGLSSIHAYDKIQSNFLFYWLKTQKHVLVNKSTGSTFSAITVDTVKKILLPIPPITEQLRITQKILDLNSNIESIKASLR